MSTSAARSAAVRHLDQWALVEGASRLGPSRPKSPRCGFPRSARSRGRGAESRRVDGFGFYVRRLATLFVEVLRTRSLSTRELRFPQKTPVPVFQLRIVQTGAIKDAIRGQTTVLVRYGASDRKAGLSPTSCSRKTRWPSVLPFGCPALPFATLDDVPA